MLIYDFEWKSNKLKWKCFHRCWMSWWWREEVSCVTSVTYHLAKKHLHSQRANFSLFLSTFETMSVFAVVTARLFSCQFCCQAYLRLFFTPMCIEGLFSSNNRLLNVVYTYGFISFLRACNPQRVSGKVEKFKTLSNIKTFFMVLRVGGA